MGTFTYFTNFILKVPSVIIICILVFVVGLKFAPDNGNIPTLGTEKAKNDGRSGQEGKRAEKDLTAVQQQLAKIIVIGTDVYKRQSAGRARILRKELYAQL